MVGDDTGTVLLRARGSQAGARSLWSVFELRCGDRFAARDFDSQIPIPESQSQFRDSGFANPKSQSQFRDSGFANPKFNFGFRDSGFANPESHSPEASPDHVSRFRWPEAAEKWLAGYGDPLIHLPTTPAEWAEWAE